MGNTLLAYPDRTLGAATVLSGGSWQAGLPLANLKERLISRVARSSNALSASTQWVEDLGSPCVVRVVSLLGHNIGLAGTVRVRGYSDAGLTVLVYDTGIQFAWPQTFTTADVLVQPNNWIFPLAVAQTARYWKWEVVDTGNVAGYVQLGRCWLGPVWQPITGIVYGSELGYEQRTVVTESLAGVPWFDQRLPRRAGTITFPSLIAIERRTAMLFQKTIGNSGEILYVEDCTQAPEDMLLYAFPATVRQVSAIRSAYYNASELPMGLVENL
jgi:hypothetical protein